ncbi:hypothetical protein AAMO2058_000548100 [Amorphochlora amoebiformis]
MAHMKLTDLHRLVSSEWNMDSIRDVLWQQARMDRLLSESILGKDIEPSQKAHTTTGNVSGNGSSHSCSNDSSNDSSNAHNPDQGSSSAFGRGHFPEENILYWAMESKQRKKVVPLVLSRVINWAWSTRVTHRDKTKRDTGCDMITSRMRLNQEAATQAVIQLYSRASRTVEVDILKHVVSQFGVDFLAGIDGENPDPDKIQKIFWRYFGGEWVLTKIRIPGFDEKEELRQNQYGLYHRFRNLRWLNSIQWKGINGKSNIIERAIVTGQRSYVTRVKEELLNSLKGDTASVGHVSTYLVFMDVFPDESACSRGRRIKNQRKQHRKAKKKKFIL